MTLLRIYDCLCDETRLRILHLLSRQPLCVCHFQDILQAPQVKISKHLLYLKRNGLVDSRQHRNWRIYSLPAKPSFELQRHLRCLQDCIRERRLFCEDLKRLKAVAPMAEQLVTGCDSVARGSCGVRVVD